MRDEIDPAARAEAERVLAGLARLTAAETIGEAAALRAEGEQAQARHKRVREGTESMLRSHDRT